MLSHFLRFGVDRAVIMRYLRSLSQPVVFPGILSLGGNSDDRISSSSPFELSELFSLGFFQAVLSLFPGLYLESAPDEGA